VIAAGHGAAAELVRDGVTGLHFRVGDAEHLASTVTTFYGDSALRQRLRTDARKEFERRYTADANYGVLMDIYRRVLVQSSAP
jgi:glycosyltransferase involved in cell wall biosynthesis